MLEGQQKPTSWVGSPSVLIASVLLAAFAIVPAPSDRLAWPQGRRWNMASFKVLEGVSETACSNGTRGVQEERGEAEIEEWEEEEVGRRTR